MAVRMINKNIVRLKDFVYGVQNAGHRSLHSSLIFNKNIQFCLSDIGEGIRDVTIKSWHVIVGDKVAQFDNICDVESDKATVTITSRYDGTVKKLYYNINDVALVGKPLVDIDTPDGASDGETSIDVKKLSESCEKVMSESTSDKGDVKQSSETVLVWDKSLATPAVRRIASEHNIKLSDVKATGKNKRVLKEDMLLHIANLNITSKSTEAKHEIVPMSKITIHMMKTMTQSNLIPTFGYSDDVDFSNLVELKSRLSKDFKIMYLPFILKAMSKSLFKYPILNSSIDTESESIIYKSYHNIAVAVATPNGLIAPVVKNVQNLSITDISNEIKRLQIGGKESTLTVEDMRDGTFAVSNIGAIAGLQGMPMIIPPNVVIVAVGKLQKLPRFDEENCIVPVHLANFTYSADHRIIDGATVARFNESVKYYLTKPELLLMDL